MGKQRSPDRDKAEKLYLQSNGTIKLKDIADTLGLPEGTIRGWKNKDKWEQKLNGTFQKVININTERSNNKKKGKSEKEETISFEVKEVLENGKITDKQKLFCIYYVKYFNATKAYQKAYKCDYTTAMVNGCNLLRKSKINDEITRLKAEKLKGAMLEPGDVLQKYIDIAFSDITDYVVFGQEEIPVMTMFGPLQNDKGETVMKKINTVRFNESVELDGTIVSEVKQGRDGASIKLYDKMKALDWLADHMDLIDTATKEKLKIEQKKMEIARIKAGNPDDDEVEDDGFIEAMKGSVEEVWSDENTEKD